MSDLLKIIDAGLEIAGRYIVLRNGKGIPEEAQAAIDLLTRARSAIPLSQTVTWVPVSERLPEKDAFYPVVVRLPYPIHLHWADNQWCRWNAEAEEYEPYLETVLYWALPLKHPNELQEVRDGE